VKNIFGSVLRRLLYKIYRDKLFPDNLSYARNGVYTKHNSDFFKLDSDFYQAFHEACQVTGFDHPAPWRVYICCWAIKKAVLELEGDLIECGVWKGISSYAGIKYSEFLREKGDKFFYLMDSWEGLNEDLLTKEESVNYARKKVDKYTNIFPEVTKTFGNMTNVKLIKGFIPDSLSQVSSLKISYLHIDMNCVAPEMAAIDYFWDKLVPGAIIVLDDYGFQGHQAQKTAFDRFCHEKTSEVLTLPTGQGLIIKS
jgi:O-methyltransferase